MSNDITLQADTRSDTGKGASRRLRKQFKVPAIVYGGKKKPQLLSVAFKDIIKALEDGRFYTQVISLEVDGKTQQTVLRDLQRHPSRGEPTHIDFQRVSAKQKITTLVPLQFINEETCVGVKVEGGEIQRNAADVEVSSLPKDIPEAIEVDMLEAKLGDVIHLSDLVLPKGVEILVLTHGEEYDQPVAAVHKPKGLISEDEAAEDEAAADEASAEDAEAAEKDSDK